MLGVVHIRRPEPSGDAFVRCAREALAAAALGGAIIDYRDLYIALGESYLQLVARGADAESFFGEAATWASGAGTSDRTVWKRRLQIPSSRGSSAAAELAR